MSTGLSLTSNKAITIIDIYKSHQKFPVFFMGGWGGGDLLFCIYCSPVWTNVTPFIFTKVMRCLVKHWEKKKRDQNSSLS